MAEELNEAEKYWIKVMQSQSFSPEINLLKAGKCPNTGSRIRELKLELKRKAPAFRLLSQRKAPVDFAQQPHIHKNVGAVTSFEDDARRCKRHFSANQRKILDFESKADSQETCVFAEDLKQRQDNRRLHHCQWTE